MRLLLLESPEAATVYACVFNKHAGAGALLTKGEQGKQWISGPGVARDCQCCSNAMQLGADTFRAENPRPILSHLQSMRVHVTYSATRTYGGSCLMVSGWLKQSVFAVGLYLCFVRMQFGTS